MEHAKRLPGNSIQCSAVRPVRPRATLCSPTSSFPAAKAMIGIAVCVLSSALTLSAQQQAFRGVIAESSCGGTDTRAAASADRETRCAGSQGKKDVTYILYSTDKGTVYELDDQTRPQRFAAKNVVVIGTLDRGMNTIHVYDMILALPPKITQAKFVYIDCDTCLRGMASAKQAALEGLLDWKRFTLVSEPQRADLVFLFSPNKYLGDYVTRQGPDPRPVRVMITYMNVLDPHTGESLWGDSAKAGSWFVAKATKRLISELRGQLEAEEGQADRLVLQDKSRNLQPPPFVGK